jgi:hypothetical protein
MRSDIQGNSIIRDDDDDMMIIVVSDRDGSCGREDEVRHMM